MKRRQARRYWWHDAVLALGLAVLVIASRAWIDVPNFKPLMAAMLVSGMLFYRSRWAIGGLLAGLAMSDLWLGGYPWPVMAAVYGALLFPLLPGRLLQARRRRAAPVLAASLMWSAVCAVVFFVATNLAVWYFMPWYDPTAAGLAHCFLLALPFLKWTLLGNLTFTSLFVGGLLAGDTWRGLASKPVPVPVRRHD